MYMYTYQHTDSTIIVYAILDIHIAVVHQLLDRHKMFVVVYQEYLTLLNDSHLVFLHIFSLHCLRHMLVRNVQDELFIAENRETNKKK